jgi:hypothetical protein
MPCLKPLFTKTLVLLIGRNTQMKVGSEYDKNNFGSTTQISPNIFNVIAFFKESHNFAFSNSNSYPSHDGNGF